MRSWPLLLCFALLCTAAASAQTPEPITREQALALPREQLLETLLGQSADLFVEVERPTFRGLFGPNAPMRRIRFATAPERRGELCQATVLSFGLSADEAQMRRWLDSRGELVLREHVAAIYAQEVYKVVPQGTDCRAAGRVIPEEDGDLDQRHYFTVEGQSAWLVPLVFRRIAEDARTNAALAVQCDPGWRRDEGLCERPLSVLQALDLDALLGVGFYPCESDRNQTCVAGTFLIEGVGNSQKQYRVTAPVDLSGYPVNPRLLGPVRIEYSQMIVE